MEVGVCVSNTRSRGVRARRAAHCVENRSLGSTLFSNVANFNTYDNLGSTNGTYVHDPTFPKNPL